MCLEKFFIGQNPEIPFHKYLARANKEMKFDHDQVMKAALPFYAVKKAIGMKKKLMSSLPSLDLLAYLMKRGPKTVFFWAPAFKWSLVIAGISDLRRPVEQLSIAQTASLAATGVIWSRYSLVIIPKNYSLFSVNVFVAATQLYQLYRAIRYYQDLKQKEPIEN